MNCNEAIDTVAADFVSQYTETDLNNILTKTPAELQSYLQAVAASNLEYAIGILPGRPSRPNKPTV